MRYLTALAFVSTMGFDYEFKGAPVLDQTQSTRIAKLAYESTVITCKSKFSRDGHGREFEGANTNKNMNNQLL